MPLSDTTDTLRASGSRRVSKRSSVLRPHRDSSVTSTASMCRAPHRLTVSARGRSTREHFLDSGGGYPDDIIAIAALIEELQFVK